eukprot:s4219_g11.t2
MKIKFGPTLWLVGALPLAPCLFGTLPPQSAASVGAQSISNICITWVIPEANHCHLPVDLFTLLDGPFVQLQIHTSPGPDTWANVPGGAVQCCGLIIPKPGGEAIHAFEGRGRVPVEPLRELLAAAGPPARSRGGAERAPPDELEIEAEENEAPAAAQELEEEPKDCEFRLYLVTADKEMELPSRVQFKIATINFTADQSALDDFFLARLAQQGEAMELLSFVQNQREFLMLEDQLLSQLTERETGELFEEEVTLAAVATSFGRVQELREALGEALRSLQAQLEKTRSSYSDLAEHCTRLFQSLDGMATCFGGAPFLCSLVDIGESASAACQALLKQQRSISDRSDGPRRTSPDLGLWPTPAWRSVCALAELHTPFRDLPTHIQENLDSWRKALHDVPVELSASTASYSSYYPAPFNELSESFSRVLLVSTLQPALASRELLLYSLEVLRGGDEDEGMAVEVSGPVLLEEALNSALLLSDRNRGGGGAEQKEEGRRNSEAPAPRKKSEERTAALPSSASRKMSFRKKAEAAPETSVSKNPRKKSMVDGQLESSASISSRVSKSSGVGLERKKSMADQGDSGSPRSPSMGKKMERNRSMVDRSGTNTLSRTGSADACQKDRILGFFRFVFVFEAKQLSGRPVSPQESLALESDAGTVAGESDFGVSARRRRREARPKKGVTRPLLLVTALDVEPGRVLSQLAAAQPLEQFIGAKQQETGDPELRVINCGKWQAPREGGALVQSIQDAYKRGRWLLIEHIHLVPSWLPHLDALLATILEDGPDFFDRSQGSALPGFRLFLSVPSTAPVSEAVLPAALILKCVRVAWELPRGSKALLQRAGALKAEERELGLRSLSPHPGAISKAKETKGAKDGIRDDPRKSLPLRCREENRLWESCSGIDQASAPSGSQKSDSSAIEMAFHVALQLFEDLCTVHSQRSEKPSEKPVEGREARRPAVRGRSQAVAGRRILSSETEEHPTPLALTHSNDVTMDTIPAIEDTSPVQLPSPAEERGESTQMSIRDQLESARIAQQMFHQSEIQKFEGVIQALVSEMREMQQEDEG